VPAGGFTFAGLVALRDPVRATAARTVEEARRAGIRTLILTGDQGATAAAVARELGLPGEVLDGSAVGRLLEESGPRARERLARVSVFARVTPSDKLAIVRALRASGEVVAMVGDGVNDAPALKAADIGVAIGRGSTDLARQTADVVVDSEDLASIVGAVAEGRILQDNLRRTVRFLFATNMSEVALMLGAALFGSEPLTALQLLWINLVTDTLPALALALEPGDPSVLNRPPAPPGSSFLSRSAFRRVMRDGLLIGGAGAAAFAAGGTAAAFAVLPAVQLGYALPCAAPDAREPGRGHGRLFHALMGASAALQVAALLVPPLRAALRLPVIGPSLAVAAAAGFGLPWAATRGLLLVRRAQQA
jgi:Ca2+-transporting ATPase